MTYNISSDIGYTISIDYIIYNIQHNPAYNIAHMVFNIQYNYSYSI